MALFSVDEPVVLRSQETLLVCLPQEHKESSEVYNTDFTRSHMSQNNMQDQGAAGGSAAGAHSAELLKAEKTIESLKYELRQVRPFLEQLTHMSKVHEDLRSEKKKLEEDHTKLITDFNRLSQDHRSLLGNKPDLSEAEMDDLLQEQEAAHVRLMKRRVRNEAMEKLQEKFQENPSFVCPISCEVFKDAVVVEDGHTYNRQHITKWISENRYVDVNGQYVWNSPMTGAHCLSTKVFPNIDKQTAMFNALEDAVDELVAKRRRISTPAP